jgi:hypothetical protein
MRLVIVGSLAVIGWFTGVVLGVVANAPQAPWTGLMVGVIGGWALAYRTPTRSSARRDRANQRVADFRR